MSITSRRLGVLAIFVPFVFCLHRIADAGDCYVVDWVGCSGQQQYACDSYACYPVGPGVYACPQDTGYQIADEYYYGKEEPEYPETGYDESDISEDHTSYVYCNEAQQCYELCTGSYCNGGSWSHIGGPTFWSVVDPEAYPCP